MLRNALAKWCQNDHDWDSLESLQLESSATTVPEILKWEGAVFLPAQNDRCFKLVYDEDIQESVESARYIIWSEHWRRLVHYQFLRHVCQPC